MRRQAAGAGIQSGHRRDPQVSTVTQSNAASAEESAAAAEELNAQSRVVHQLVARLTELAEGANGTPLEDAVEV